MRAVSRLYPVNLCIKCQSAKERNPPRRTQNCLRLFCSNAEALELTVAPKVAERIQNANLAALRCSIARRRCRRVPVLGVHMRAHGENYQPTTIKKYANRRLYNTGPRPT